MTVCLQESIHQGSQFFNELSRIRQCAFMAFHALFSCESELAVQLWTTEFIDQILIKGDRMFLHALSNQLILDTSSLLVSHLPVLVFTGIESSVRVAYEPPFFGSCSISFESHPPYWSLSDALMNTFMISWYAICVLEGYMIAIIKTSLQLQDYFYTFDSHSRDSSGWPTGGNEGTAVLMTFVNLSFWQIIFAHYHNASVSASLKY